MLGAVRKYVVPPYQSYYSKLIHFVSCTHYASFITTIYCIHLSPGKTSWHTDPSQDLVVHV